MSLNSSMRLWRQLTNGPTLADHDFKRAFPATVFASLQGNVTSNCQSRLKPSVNGGILEKQGDKNTAR